jgi:pimeloyl-ACP methyl ester carboxylesterase/DNA-binding CsgD family transcriptional regulator
VKPPVSRFVEVGSGQVGWAVFGTGRTAVLFAPHWATNIEVMWYEPRFARFAGKLASMAQVVQLDKRGFGVSDELPGGALPDFDTAAEDTIAVLDEARFGKVVVVAADFAVAATIELAVRQPERMAGMVLIGGTARLRRGPDYPIGFSDRVLRVALENLERNWTETTAAATREQGPSLAGDADYVTDSSRYRRSTMSRARAREVAQEVFDWDIRASAARVGCPTVVVHRRDDRYIPIDHGRYLADRIPGARFVELDGDDHTPWAGDQDDVLNVIAELVDALTDGTDRRTVPGRAARPRFGWRALTDAERDVVAELVAGLSNKQAARRLGVSPRTVESQLRSVYAKLGIRTRAELATAASAQRGTP